VSDLVLLVRLRDGPGVLERLLGLLRRRVLPVRTLSVYRSEAGLQEAAIRFDRVGSPERVAAEIAALVDVVSVRRLPSRALGDAREMAVARTRGPVGAWPETRHGSLTHRGDAVELTGTPAEIDRALRLMTERGVLAGAARSGEIFPPPEDDSDFTEGEIDGSAED